MCIQWYNRPDGPDGNFISLMGLKIGSNRIRGSVEVVGDGDDLGKKSKAILVCACLGFRQFNVVIGGCR